MAKSKQNYREDTAGYCRTLTDRQLENVYADEKERAKRGGEVGAVAKIFAQSAKEELVRRGIL